MNKLSFYDYLTNRAAVYIPTTHGDNGKADVADVHAAVDEAVEIMAELFGGATVTQGRGAWTNVDGNVVKETVYIVTAAADSVGDDEIDRLVDFAEAIRNRFEQEAVTLELDGAMYFIDGAHTSYEYDVSCSACGDGGCIHCSPKDFVDFPIYG